MLYAHVKATDNDVPPQTKLKELTLTKERAFYDVDVNSVTIG
jgi:hypothetical protein